VKYNILESQTFGEGPKNIKKLQV